MALERKELTPNFNLSEFHQKDGKAEVPETHETALRHLCEHVLEPMRKKYGPCTIHSGFRSKDYNRRIGGARSSFHVYNEHQGREVAADIRFARGNPRKWRRTAIRLLNKKYGRSRGGIGYYPQGGFIHVDTRLNGRSYWNGS